MVYNMKEIWQIISFGRSRRYFYRSSNFFNL